jgi:hypothetical protein
VNERFVVDVVEIGCGPKGVLLFPLVVHRDLVLCVSETIQVSVYV